MTPEEARQALEMSNIDSDYLGFWTYVLIPDENSYGGRVVHFWPLENARKRPATIWIDGFFDPWHKITERHSVCNLDTQAKGWMTPTDDFYNRRRMPRCKRCVKKLTQLAGEAKPC